MNIVSSKRCILIMNLLHGLFIILKVIELWCSIILVPKLECLIINKLIYIHIILKFILIKFFLIEYNVMADCFVSWFSFQEVLRKWKFSFINIRIQLTFPWTLNSWILASYPVRLFLMHFKFYEIFLIKYILQQYLSHLSQRNRPISLKIFPEWSNRFCFINQF